MLSKWDDTSRLAGVWAGTGYLALLPEDANTCVPDVLAPFLYSIDVVEMCRPALLISVVQTKALI